MKNSIWRFFVGFSISFFKLISIFVMIIQTSLDLQWMCSSFFFSLSLTRIYYIIWNRQKTEFIVITSDLMYMRDKLFGLTFENCRIKWQIKKDIKRKKEWERNSWMKGPLQYNCLPLCQVEWLKMLLQFCTDNAYFGTKVRDANKSTHTRK